MENGSNKVADARDGDEPRIRTTDSCVSISLNDSWTGRKLLESFGYDSNSYVTADEFNVRNLQFIILQTLSTFQPHRIASLHFRSLFACRSIDGV